VKVCVSRSIDCAHQLEGTLVHGHTYTVTACVSCEIGENGKAYSMEFLQGQLGEILGAMDHRLLNEVIAIPTAENIALNVQSKFALRGIKTSIRAQIGNGGYVETE